MNTQKKMTNRTAVALVALWAGLLYTQAVACLQPDCPDCTSGTWPNCVPNCSTGQDCCNVENCETCIGTDCLICGGDPNQVCCAGSCCDTSVNCRSCVNGNCVSCGADPDLLCCDHITCYDPNDLQCCGYGDGTTCPHGYCCDDGDCVLGKWNDWEPLPSFQVYGDITDKINYIFTWLTSDISIDYNADGNKRTGDCCNDGTLIEDGKEETEATVTVEVFAESVPVGQYGRKIELEFDFSWGSAKLEAAVGLFASVGTNIEVGAGERINVCLDENCIYWSAGINATFAIELKAEVEACLAVSIFKKCCSWSLPTVGISTDVGGYLSYNENDCDDGFSAYITIGPLNAYIAGTLWPGDEDGTTCDPDSESDTFSWEVFPLTVIYPSDS